MKTIVANWKMHLGVRESVALARGVLRALRGVDHAPEIVLCPSFTALQEVHKVLARSRVHLGAQNMSFERSGAFTGEVSSLMLEDVGANYVLIGHGERREVFHENNDIVAKKFAHAVSTSLTPILCVGEPYAVHKKGEEISFVKEQLTSALPASHFPRGKTLMIAYEPLWAIGTGSQPTAEEVRSMHEMIRAVAARRSGLEADRIVILYGGSVDGENAHEYLRETEVDGVLVGGASIKIHQFTDVIGVAQEVMRARNE